MSDHYCARCKREVSASEYGCVDDKDFFRRYGTCAKCGETPEKSDHKIECPVCGFEDDEPWELVEHDGDETDFECSNCSHPLNVSLSVEYTYTIKALNPESAEGDGQ